MARWMRQQGKQVALGDGPQHSPHVAQGDSDTVGHQTGFITGAIYYWLLTSIVGDWLITKPWPGSISDALWVQSRGATRHTAVATSHGLRRHPPCLVAALGMYQLVGCTAEPSRRGTDHLTLRSYPPTWLTG
jgi:hypothetical protein